MAYTTTPDLEAAAGGADRLVQLADWDGDGVADASVLASAQSTADSIIDSYAAIRYAVPIESPSAAIVQHAAAEAIYWIRSRRGMLTEDDVRQKELRDKWLDQLSRGRVRPSDPTPPDSTAVKAARRVSTRDVSRENLKGYS